MLKKSSRAAQNGIFRSIGVVRSLVLAQLLGKVQSAIELASNRIVLWSDSTITLSWISSCSRKWSVFVANRIGEIQQLTCGANWRHIPTSENLADLLPRSTNPRDLIESFFLWWHGPKFLSAN